MPCRSFVRALLMASVVSLGALAAGCGEAKPKCGGGAEPCVDNQPGSFESDLPGANGGGDKSGRDLSTAGSAGASTPSIGTPQNAGEAAADSAGGAERAIVEADIIQLAGDRLFALSRIAGLAVIDVSKPTNLKLLGRYRELSGTPFEMYLRDDVAVLMFAGWGQYVTTDDGDYTYISTSKIISLDVANPASIGVLGTFDVPGTISDSRIVGNVLYVAGYEDGYCWRCEQNKPTTSVSSLDVANPRAMRKVDELRYSDTTGQYSWQRSITVTDKRMYVAGPEYGQNGPIGSTIQVIDISDAGGDLVEGATLQARGQISSRWQMDEFEGVLRVVSQSGSWQTSQPPQLQTFKVVSSQEFEPLARLNIVIPVRETLRSARFDGTRGYLITAEQKDPLFTLDLTDPENPKQVGELVMPGFLYHMEPRGDRVLGLGYDQGNPAGSITVSLFDVSNLATPTMISRVNFGGSWGSLPEDQDRIHKVFRVLPAEGLILVPFSGYEQSSQAEFCGGKSIGGVQLVDYANDALTLRGSAPSTGQARRALIHKSHLLSVSDERVEAFDISDRSQPKAASELIMANTVLYAARLDGDVVARVTTPNWDGRYFVELVEKANAEDVNRKLGQLSLDSVFDADVNPCNRWWNIESYHVDGSRLYLLYNGYRYANSGNGTRETGVVVIDAADPTDPKLIGQTKWTAVDDGNGWYPYYGDTYGGFGQTQPYLWHGDALAFLELQSRYAGAVQSNSTRLRVVDLRDPTKPRVSVQQLLSNHQYSGLIADGDRILTSRYPNQTPTSTGRVRFFVDAFDISDPSAPAALPAVNVPGVLVHYDAASKRGVTSKLSRVLSENLSYQKCYETYAYADFTSDNPNTWDPMSPGRCTGYVQSLHLIELRADGAVLEDSLQLANDERVASSSAGEDRFFATISRGSSYYYGGGRGIAIADCAGPCGGYYGGVTNEPVKLLVLGGFGSGAFEVGRLEVERNSNDWWGFWGAPPVYASGQKALLLSNGDAAIVDASNLANVHVVRTEVLIGSASSVEIKDGTALLALNSQGIQWIDL